MVADDGLGVGIERPPPPLELALRDGHSALDGVDCSGRARGWSRGRLVRVTEYCGEYTRQVERKHGFRRQNEDA